ncbi:MAG TPA: anti-sigma F factor antagonist [Clostridiales bacterium]|nr:anti-sigma F factor antagonist [Clostridiales bacterium]
MQLDIWKKGNTLVVALKGELDHHTAAGCRERIDNALLRPGIRNLILDLSELAFMDSSGIGVILGRYRTVTRRGGKMAAMHIQPEVMRIFRMAGLEGIIPVCGGTDDAIRIFERERMA